MRLAAEASADWRCAAPPGRRSGAKIAEAALWLCVITEIRIPFDGRRHDLSGSRRAIVD
jgi:hypothetical protein